MKMSLFPWHKGAFNNNKHKINNKKMTLVSTTSHISNINISISPEFTDPCILRLNCHCESWFCSFLIRITDITLLYILNGTKSWIQVLYFLSPLCFLPSLCLQYPSHSDSSLATGSSEGSLQTTLEEGLSFSISPPQNLELPLPTAPLPLVCPLQLPEDGTAISSPVQTLRPRPTPSSTLTLQATRGHQRSQSSGRGSTSPGYTRDDSIDPSDEDLGIGIGSSIGGCGSSQAGNSEHLSETLSSLSLTSLLSPSSLVYPGGAVKKCNSTGSLEQGGMLLSSRGRESRREILGMELMDPQGFLANPWTGVLVDTRRGDGRGDLGDGEQGFKGKSSSQTTVGPCRKNR